MLLLTVAAYAASAEDHDRRHNYMLSDDFIDEINREATTWRAGRNFHPLTSTNYIKVCLFTWVGIQWRADDIYARRFCAAVLDLLLNFDHFW